MALKHPSNFNVYIPQATGQVIGFMRDPAEYAINRYVQLIKSPKEVGVYYKIGNDQPVRVVSTDFGIWQDGQKRPRHPENKLRFDTVEFQCVRRNYNTPLGWKMIEQADLPILVSHSRMVENQLMTSRVQRVMTLLETTSNWGSNTADATTLNNGAGLWSNASNDPTSGNYLAIKKSLDEAMRQIDLLTNGRVNYTKKRPRLLMNPNAAKTMSQSPEIHDYIKSSPSALAQVRGDVPSQNGVWGLPDILYGFDIVIENASIVTSNDPDAGADVTIASGNRKYIKSDSSAVILSQVGDLDGNYGAPSFSTVQLYYHQYEVKLQTFDNVRDEFTDVDCSEDIKEVLAAPVSGYLITNIM